MIRTLALILIALAAVALAAAPMLAQVADSTATLPPVPNASDLLSYAFMGAMGFLVPTLYAQLERVAPSMRVLPPTVKRAIVFVIPGIVALGIAKAKGWWPALPLDPTAVQAALASAIAFAIHAGDTAKDAKAQTADRGD